MTKKIENARDEYLNWYDLLFVFRGDIQIMRHFIDSSLDYYALLEQDNRLEME